MKEIKYTICGMCAVRCPLAVELDENGQPLWLEGNQHDKAMGQSLCPKGGAALAQRLDRQRPLGPLLRVGKRGEGDWREATWEEAYTYITTRLQTIMDQYGPRAILFSDRGGPFADFRKAFVRALGSPNYVNHDCTCGRNVHHASLSVYGLGRTDLAYDYPQARHIVLFGRNITESLKVKEVKAFLEARKKGARITYIDPRASITAGKATRFWQIRPGTDYALLLGMAAIILEQDYYDQEFAERFISGLDALRTFLAPYTPEWTEQQTGIAASELQTFCEELNQDRPRVIIHPGWMLARYQDSFYAARMIHILNALLGSIEHPGGLFFPKGPEDLGQPGLRSLTSLCPPVEEERLDGCGTTYPQFDAGAGLLQTAYAAIDAGVPYPVKAYLVHRHNPLLALPDPEEQKRILNKLDLLVAVDVHYSETAWFADVILPEHTFLERSDILRTERGLKPGYGRRQQCVYPVNNSRPGWEIYLEILRRLGKGDALPFTSIEDIWYYQLQDTGLRLEDFDATGFVTLSEQPLWYDRSQLIFPTDSGKIEIISHRWEQWGIPSLAQYQPPIAPAAGSFRLLFGRAAFQTHGQHQNNPLLHELAPENELWIHPEPAAELGIVDGAPVQVMAGEVSGRIRAKVTPRIHPQAVFMLHGFGTTVPAQKRAYGHGLADQQFMAGKLMAWDRAGGGLSLADCFVQLQPLAVSERMA